MLSFHEEVYLYHCIAFGDLSRGTASHGIKDEDFEKLRLQLKHSLIEYEIKRSQVQL